MKKYSFLILFIVQFSFSQEKNGASVFWEKLNKHCGNAYEGTIKEAPANDDFRNKKLVIHFKKCEKNIVKIPFFVGDDKSRTWILTFDNNLMTLKHDHRHKDGSEDKVTQYGGTASNSGLENIQMFPADSFTCKSIPYASNNVWWFTISETELTYNLRRIGTDRLFSVTFDLTKTVSLLEDPWGWEE